MSGSSSVETASKEAAGKPEPAAAAGSSFTGEIDVETASKEATGKPEPAAPAGSSFTGEIDDVTKAEVGAAGPGVVTEVDWIEFVFPRPPAELLERKAEPTGSVITKEMVPDVIIDRIKIKRPFKKLPPINSTSALYDMFPKNRDVALATIAHWNYLIDLQADVLRQHTEKGFAEVGVDFTDGVKKIFILPHSPLPSLTMMPQQD